jgi:hypothetical protein
MPALQDCHLEVFDWGRAAVIRAGPVAAGRSDVEETLTDSQIQALVFAGAMVLLAFTSWLAGRRARRVLGRALGREIREGEETSLRAWMSVPVETLATVENELRNTAAEQVLGAVDRMNRYTRDGRHEHEPYAEHTSIR